MVSANLHTPALERSSATHRTTLPPSSSSPLRPRALGFSPLRGSITKTIDRRGTSGPLPLRSSREQPLLRRVLKKSIDGNNGAGNGDLGQRDCQEGSNASLVALCVLVVEMGAL